MHAKYMPSRLFFSSLAALASRIPAVYVHAIKGATHRQQFAEKLCASCSPVAVNEHIRAFLGRAVNGFQADAGAPGAQDIRKA